MSTQALSASTTTPPDVTAALSRVSEIEQMLAQAANGFNTTGSTSASSTTSSSSDFSSLLASAASASDTAGSSTSSAGESEYASTIDAAASAYGLNPSILTGLVKQESGFNADAVSSSGAEGLTQVMPENFAADGITDPFDPTQSIYGGAKQLSEDLSEFGGNYSDALAAYNAGSGAVEEYGGVPPYAQTQSYVTDILAYAQQQNSAGTASGDQSTGAGMT